jgi:hypothetical protein
MIDADAIRYRWDTVGRNLDERGRRMFAAAEVRTAGFRVCEGIGLCGRSMTIAADDEWWFGRRGEPTPVVAR